MEWTIGDVFLSMLMFFFWFMFIWIFIGAFADIFRRNDLSGWAKAGWIFLIVVMPFLGVLIYMIARPKVTEQDMEMFAAARAQNAGGVSVAEEIAKLDELRRSGAISNEEFARFKEKAFA